MSTVALFSAVVMENHTPQFWLPWLARVQPLKLYRVLDLSATGWLIHAVAPTPWGPQATDAELCPLCGELVSVSEYDTCCAAVKGVMRAHPPMVSKPGLVRTLGGAAFVEVAEVAEVV